MSTARIVLGAIPFTAFADHSEAAPLGGPDLDARFETALHLITLGIEAAGITIIVIGLVAATVSYARDLLGSRDREDAFHDFRSSLGRAILLGLEFLVAADIIGTVAIEPTLSSLAVLAGIVLIRTFLSFSLEIEIEGRPPWRRAARRPSPDT
jgi:uncharacterized membrane protein